MQIGYAHMLPKLRLSSTVMSDIRDNVAVGRTVTVHEKTINYKGWKGSGYIIIDPQTGSGAYLIDGGANGAYLVALGFSLIALSIFVFIGLLAKTAATAGTTLGATLLVTPELLAGLSVGIAMIARGFEIMTGSYRACQIYRYSFSLALGAFTAKYSWIIGFIATNAYGGLQEFIGSDVMCVRNTKP